MRKDKAAKSGRKVKNFRPSAREAIKQILALADAAQIPFAAPAIAIARRFIETLDDMETNTQAAEDLLELVQRHTERLVELIQCINEADLSDTGDPQTAVIHREIAKFECVLTSAVQTIKGRRSIPFLPRFLGRSTIRTDLQRCRSQLTSAHSELNDYIYSEIYINARKLLASGTHVSPPKASPRSAFETAVSKIRMVGAEPISSEGVKIVKKVSAYRRPFHSKEPWWYENVSKAKIGGETKLVKFYYKQSEAEESFLRDLQHLAQNPYPNLPRIEAYCGTATTPFVVLAAASIMSLELHLAKVDQNAPDDVLLHAWKLLIALRDAAQFLWDSCPELGSSKIFDAIEAAVVDENGEVIVAPPYGKKSPKGEGIIALMSPVVTHMLKQPETRGCRSLGLALMENSSFVLGRHPDELPEPSDAVRFLRQLWPSPSDKTRDLSWRFDFPTQNLALGDLGVFDSSGGRAYGFRKMTNVAEELGLEISGPRFGVVRTSPREFRNTCSDYESGSKYFFHWTQTAIGGWRYLIQNAQRQAAVYGVLPQDLILITKVFWSLNIETPELGVSPDQQVLLDIQLQPNGRLHGCSWSSMPDVVSSSKLCHLRQEADELKPSFRPQRYVQLEPSDIDPGD